MDITQLVVLSKCYSTYEKNIETKENIQMDFNCNWSLFFNYALVTIRRQNGKHRQKAI